MHERDDRIDFLRGVALIAMFIDHVPASPLSLLTFRSFSFCDAAELFFFLSGMTASIIYLPQLREAGLVVALVRILRRAWQLYAAQMMLLVFVAAEVALIVAATGNQDYFGGFRIRHFFDQTDATILPALLLSYQPAYLDILPVYVVLFLALPLVLYGLARRAWVVFALSTALYLAVQAEGWTFHSYPWNVGWQFNPLAWQFIFVMGATFGAFERVPQIVRSKWAIAIAAAIAAVCAVVQLSVALNPYIPVIPSLWAWIPDASKSDLGWLRLLSFAALAILAARILPRRGRIDRHIAVAAVVACGRHSLAAFSLSVLLALLGQVTWDHTAPASAMQALMTLAGIAIMIAFAWLLDWMRATDRAGVSSGRRLSAATA